MSPHVLVAPEGDAAGRRHAHTACVESARRAGRLPTRDEWLASEAGGGPRGRGLPWRRTPPREAEPPGR
ncbi:MAG TPA: hypothetical protein VFA44_03255 [Gaiellaceae bacterium]|nr:hypothetical protein [Gaiellaceae bacterium]